MAQHPLDDKSKQHEKTKGGAGKAGDDPMGTPPGDSPPRNPESAPGGDQTGGATQEEISGGAADPKGASKK